MSDFNETFFTRVGCMDGRIQIPLRIYGQQKFGAEYPDTITEAGEVGVLAHNPTPEYIENFKNKLDISINTHHSKGVLVHGHQECAGNPVDDATHKEDVRRSVELVKQLINNRVPVVGVFVNRSASDPKLWEVEEL